MKRYVILCTGLSSIMLLLFAVAELLDVPVLTDPEPVRRFSGVAAGLLGVALLVVDAVVPVPSSAVMVALGALYGTVPGAGLSMGGSLGGFALAFALGRRGLGGRGHAVPGREQDRADRLVSRWGLVALMVSRPVPILSEAVAVAAGASSLRWRSAVGAASVGYLPAATLYAMAGATGATLSSGALVLATVVVSAGAAVLAAPRAHAPARSGPADGSSGQR